MNYCCKEVHAECGRVPGSANYKGLSEFAKLRVFCAHVPYVPLLLTCLYIFFVPTCLRALIISCLYVLIFHQLSCLQPLSTSYDNTGGYSALSGKN